VIKNGAAITGNVEIGVAIVVVITHGDALAVMIFGRDTGFFSDVGEGAVTVVVIERGTERVIGLIEFGRAGLDEVEVHQAVLIVIEPGDAGAHSFKVELFLGLRGVLQKSDASLFADVGEFDGDRRAGFLGRLRGESFQCERRTESGEQ